MNPSDRHDRSFALYGTDKSEAQPVRLVAGRLTADLAGGQLRAVRYDGVEVLRGVAFLVRDRDWGTYDPDIDNLVVDQRADGFSVSYTARCHGPENTELVLRVTILSEAGGPLVFHAEAMSRSGFETCRCGFCILHPIVGLAGQPVTVTHVDGSIETSTFPDLIAPWQPFMAMRGIAHRVMPEVTAECLMEGDTFEMEDQRNWSDASYKTYVRPLALPWPYTIEANEPVRQRVVLTITDSRKALPAPAAGSAGPELVRLTPGAASGRMPAIGLVVTPEEAATTFAAGARLNALGVQELLFHFDPLAGHDGRALADFAAIAALHQGTTTLEIALPCRTAVTDELAEIAAMARAAGFAPDAIVVSPAVDRQSTPPGSAWPDCPPLDAVYSAARAAFPACRLGGGMLSYFTELNRKRVPPDMLDFITHCTNPIVHAADDLSVMQTLEALPFITRSVRSIYGDKAYRICPSTIPMRHNPYGSRTMDNPAGGRIAMANTDPRHTADFAAAFALGYAARVVEAGLDCLTLSALTGPFGLIAGPGEPVGVGRMRPLHGVVQGLAALFDARWTQCVSSAPDKVLALAVEKQDGGRLLWVANLTPRVLTVDVSAWSEDASSAVDRLELQPFGLGRVE
ncbi:D-apionate lactonase [Rhizobium sp. HT1-10]|uniref:D-apionate lactonase n=1 Tax=Rhizobium sp. HT1-10 TaxID=3111638 RepID=UPI003C1450EB